MSRTLATYNLKFPIVRETRDAGGNEHEEVMKPEGFCVVIKRPRGRDVKIMDQFEGHEITGSMALLERISNLSDDELELIDAEDLSELGNLLNMASTSGRTTGEAA